MPESNISKIIIYIPVPTDQTTTSMYLPLFIAKEKGIINETLKEYNSSNIDVVIQTPDKETGDRQAIDAMNDCEDSEILALAIADPTALQQNHKESIVIGALISKLSFWAISKDKSKKEINELVYYDPRFMTGNMIGNKLQNDLGILPSKAHAVGIGEEIKYFNKYSKDALIITPDLLRVAEKCTCEKEGVEPQAHLKISFATNEDPNIRVDKDYITTAIFARRSDLSDKSRKVLIGAIIESIQIAKFILYSSEEISKEIFLKMDWIKQIKNESIIDKISKFVINRMQEEKFYPYDTNITKRQWNNTFRNVKHKLRYHKFVDNSVVFKSERTLANELGITFLNFLPKPLIAILYYIKLYWWTVPLFLFGIILIYIQFKYDWAESAMDKVGNLFTIVSCLLAIAPIYPAIINKLTR